MKLKNVFIIREEGKVIQFPQDRVSQANGKPGEPASVTMMPQRGSIATKRQQLIASFNKFVGSDGMIDNFKLAIVTKPYKVDSDFEVRKGEFVMAAPLLPGKYTSGWADVWGGGDRMDSVPQECLRYLE